MFTIQFVLLAGFLLRLIGADQSFWLDEGATLVIARQSIPQILSSLQGDFHPPLYYLLIHFWLKLGINNEVFLRLPNIIFGTSTIYFVYQLIKKLDGKFRHLAALLAALFLALNPLHIYYSQELRMYALSALLATISWWLLVLPKKNKPQLWFALVTTLNLFTFYGAFFNLAAQLGYLYWAKRKQLREIWPWLLLPLVLFTPWLTTLSTQLSGGEWLKSTLPGWGVLSGTLSLKSLALIPIKFVLGRINLADSTALKAIGGLASLYLLMLMYLGRKTRASKLLLSWTIIPLAIAMVVSLWSPVLGYWRYIFLLPAVVSLASLGITHLKPPYREINIGLVLLIFLAANLVFWTTPRYQREDWRSVRTFQSQFNQVSTLYVFAFSDAFAPFRWYLPNAEYIAPLRLLKSDPEALDTALSQATQSKSTVLYFEYLAALTDPEENIRRWFENAGYELRTTHDIQGVGFIHEYHPQLLY